MKKGKLLTFISVIVFAVGAVVMLLPLAVQCSGTGDSARASAHYAESLTEYDEANFEEMLADAHDYNDALSKRAANFVLPDDVRAEYDSLLDPAGEGVMGYVEIPDINVTLPIFHGTDEQSLSTSIGHLEWTSLPVGGKSTHCVLSGHNGLRSAALLRDLDKLKKGDIFYIRVLNQLLAYKVDKITVVEPDEVEALFIEENRDYCTLMTCTPYGSNTHRLLVRGARIDVPKDTPGSLVTSDATQVEQHTVAFLLAAPLLFLLALVSVILYMSIGEGDGNNEKKHDQIHGDSDVDADNSIDCGCADKCGGVSGYHEAGDADGALPPGGNLRL
ncbi:MAG: class C sortase [Clostridia bacterium]|nr:class C sortase [Clostridia bacterium]